MGDINLNPIWRAVTGKNKAGKFIYGTLGLGAVAVGGNEIGMTDTQLLITVISLVAVFLIGLFVDNPMAVKKLESIAEDISEDLVKATDPKSDGKEKITKNEIKAMVVSLLKKNFKKGK